MREGEREREKERERERDRELESKWIENCFRGRRAVR